MKHMKWEDGINLRRDEFYNAAKEVMLQAQQGSDNSRSNSL